MNAVELGGIITGGVVALGALIVAIGQIGKGLKSFWAFLRKTIHTVDIISAIPARLDDLELHLTATDRTVTDHIKVADRKADLLDSLNGQVRLLLELGREVHHEVRPNGGSSIKDAVSRLESGMQGLYMPATGPLTSPITIITPAKPRTTRTRTRAPKEPNA